jgi:hypothetical protein
MRTSRQTICAGLVLVALLTLAGCGGSRGGSATENPRAARLCEDEVYRMNEQVKAMQKQSEQDKATAAAAVKEQAEAEKAYSGTADFMMNQLREKDAEIAKLNQRIAELEKGQMPASPK